MVPYNDNVHVALQHDETPEYLASLVSMMIQPDDTPTPNGELRGPFDPNTAVYAMNGSKTVTTHANTTRAVIVFDPEITARAGQAAVYCMQLDSANQMTALNQIDIDVPTNNFSCLGVMSARLSVSNSSAIDGVAGDAVCGVLNVVPSNIMTMSMTQLKQKIPNSVDYQNARMNVDGVTSFAMSAHLGKNVASTDDQILSHIASKRVEYTQKGPSTTTSSENGFVATDALFTVQTAAQLARQASVGGAPGVLGATSTIWDTQHLAIKPFSIATYAATLTINGALVITSTGGGAGQTPQFSATAFDAYGAVLSTQRHSATQHSAITSDPGGTLNLDFHFERTARPIDRIAIHMVESDSLTMTWSRLPAGELVATLTALEARADIPTRNIHVAVCDGLNSGAALSITGSMIVNGTPAADRTFISGAPNRYQKFDEKMIEGFLQTCSVSLPRANKFSQTRILRDSIHGLQMTPEFKMALSEVNAGWFGDAFNWIGKRVREGVSSVGGLIQEAAPILHTVNNVAQSFSRAGIPFFSDAAGLVSDVTGPATEAVDWANKSGVSSAMRRF
jgi:hypothetical protein